MAVSSLTEPLPTWQERALLTQEQLAAQSADDAWRAALEILDALDHPDADDLRAKLDCQGNARFGPGPS